jgi:hypothetical protein
MNYCKIYIDTPFNLDEMDDIFLQGFKECIKIPGIEYNLFVNDSRIEDADITSSTYPVDISRYYAEVDSDPNYEVDEEDFHRSLSELIAWLRQKCAFVVASCDFEEYIFSSTGWNWTLENPLPPE